MYLIFNTNGIKQSGRIADIFKKCFLSSVFFYFLLAVFISQSIKAQQRKIFMNSVCSLVNEKRLEVSLVIKVPHVIFTHNY